MQKSARSGRNNGDDGKDHGPIPKGRGLKILDVSAFAVVVLSDSSPEMASSSRIRPSSESASSTETCGLQQKFIAVLLVCLPSIL